MRLAYTRGVLALITWVKAANGLLFNLSWLAIVVSSSALVAPLVAIAHLVVHGVFIGLKRREPLFIALVAVSGLALDHALFGAGVFVIDGAAATAPLWLSCLWPVLATTLMHAFESLQKHLLLAAVVGAVGGAASYIAGTRLSDVAFADATLGPVILAALWFVWMPLLLVVARRMSAAVATFEGVAHGK